LAEPTVLAQPEAVEVIPPCVLDWVLLNVQVSQLGLVVPPPQFVLGGDEYVAWAAPMTPNPRTSVPITFVTWQNFVVILDCPY
jgi:hypothetical protein